MAPVLVIWTGQALTGTASIELDARRTALLVIDVQNDFCHPDGFFAGFGFDVGPCAEVASRIAPVVARRAGAACRSSGR